MNVGVLGGGQLARMLALAGHNLGVRMRILDRAADAVAGQVAELHVAAFEDRTALERFAAGLDVVTYEFENVPLDAAQFLAQRVPVYPPPAALAAAQDRLTEKQFFRRLDVPTADFQPVGSADEVRAALATLGGRAILKTRRLGYDGKGQVGIERGEQCAAAWAEIGAAPAILERFVAFDRELSLIAVRGVDGRAAFYPLVENVHRGGILRRSNAPATRVTSELQALAERAALRILGELEYVGVLAIEFFQVGEALWANEMAPRVHNSGHWTIDAATTSQFENHARAILGWPLGTTTMHGAAVMLNLIGGVPPAAALLAIPGLRLHVYGKAPRPGRKVGHATILAGRDGDNLAARVGKAEALITQ